MARDHTASHHEGLLAGFGVQGHPEALPGLSPPQPVINNGGHENTL